MSGFKSNTMAVSPSYMRAISSGIKTGKTLSSPFKAIELLEDRSLPIQRDDGRWIHGVMLDEFGLPTWFIEPCQDLEILKNRRDIKWIVLLVMKLMKRFRG